MVLARHSLARIHKGNTTHQNVRQGETLLYMKNTLKEITRTSHLLCTYISLSEQSVCVVDCHFSVFVETSGVNLCDADSVHSIQLARCICSVSGYVTQHYLVASQQIC